MAKATARMVEKIVTETVQDGFVLELTRAEAVTLQLILGRVNDSSDDAGQYADGVFKALRTAGVPWGSHLYGPAFDKTFSIEFGPRSKAVVENA